MAWDWEKLNQQQQQNKGGLPPQMDDLVKQFRKMKLPGGPLLLLLIALLYFGSSTFYTVAVDEVGVVQRFGRFVRTTQPGLNFKFPAGIEKVTKVKVRRVYKEEFGFRTVGAAERSRFAASSDENSVSLMLTGDLNVAVVPWIVQYRINEPYNSL
jgi:modulator of FtsH protease HflK